MNQELNDLLSEVELETECDCCHGKGRDWEEGSGRRIFCPICDGAGYAPTPFGKKIVDLMRHNFQTFRETI